MSARHLWAARVRTNRHDNAGAIVADERGTAERVRQYSDRHHRAIDAPVPDQNRTKQQQQYGRDNGTPTPRRACFRVSKRGERANRWVPPLRYQVLVPPTPRSGRRVLPSR